jgi:alkanesulfonate monooxygenase SsuD/methylene tetrahydromethanopterin reductase-like flavin-dependent oxidoreductase (luciferase family)
MRFHVAQLTTYFPALDPAPEVYYRQILEQVALAEDLGWECFWFTEHHFIQYGGLVPNPAIMLAMAAGQTSRIRLGSAIAILPLHHPLTVAEDYAMADVASGGRLEFGVGRGNTLGDYQLFGVPTEESRPRFEEALDLITRAWASERTTHQGRYWQFDDLALLPRPVQQPHPPIWVAGTSPDTLRWAGRRGYNVMTVAHPFPPERVLPTVDAWRAGLAEAGVAPASRDNMTHLRVWVDEDAERARATAETAIARYDQVSRGRMRLEGQLAAPSEYDWAGMRAQGRNIYGTPDEVIAGIQAAARNYGSTVIGTQFNYGGTPHDAVVKAMRLFASEVMPAFR